MAEMPIGFRLISDKKGTKVDTVPLVQCKDCKYFEIKDVWGDFNGIPILVTSDCPTCNKWGGGDGCKTNPDGFCFLAEHV